MQFVTALHGNEYMPTLALASQGIEQHIGNPRALRANKRWIDSDLNAAFGKEQTDYETKRAQEILQEIPTDSTVIDFHTYAPNESNKANDAFAILVDTAMLPIALAIGIKYIVYMKHSIKKKNALIHHRHGVSIETGRHGSPRAFDTTLNVVQNLKNGTDLNAHDTLLFEVYGVTDKLGDYVNFEFYEKDGFYPVLAGENSYTFTTMMARKVERFEN